MLYWLGSPEICSTSARSSAELFFSLPWESVSLELFPPCARIPGKSGRWSCSHNNGGWCGTLSCPKALPGGTLLVSGQLVSFLSGSAENERTVFLFPAPVAAINGLKCTSTDRRQTTTQIINKFVLVGTKRHPAGGCDRWGASLTVLTVSTALALTATAFDNGVSVAVLGSTHGVRHGGASVGAAPHSAAAFTVPPVAAICMSHAAWQADDSVPLVAAIVVVLEVGTILAIYRHLRRASALHRCHRRRSRRYRDAVPLHRCHRVGHGHHRHSRGPCRCHRRRPRRRPVRRLRRTPPMGAASKPAGRGRWSTPPTEATPTHGGKRGRQRGQSQ